jgi:heme/copper-type cytochrome/quinol oxidase subunit 2
MWKLSASNKRLPFSQKMAGLDLQLSGVVMIATLVLVVTGLVIAIFWFFKRAENLSDEDRLNIERSKFVWLGSVALGVLLLATAKKEKGARMHMSVGAGRSSTLL